MNYQRLYHYQTTTVDFLCILFKSSISTETLRLNPLWDKAKPSSVHSLRHSPFHPIYQFVPTQLTKSPYYQFPSLKFFFLIFRARKISRLKCICIDINSIVIQRANKAQEMKTKVSDLHKNKQKNYRVIKKKRQERRKNS